MVYRGLHPDQSIRATLADLAAGDDRLEQPPADASWCEARDRLPKALWPASLDASVVRLERLIGQKHLAFGRPVYIADGSTVSMPDTPSLVRAFGRAGNRHGRSRFPVARITFLTRWGVETRIDSLKTTLQMNVLRSQTASHVRSEVAAIVLGHNLVWTLIHQAAQETGTPAARISFTGAVQTVLAFSGALRYASPAARPATYRRMLQAIAQHVNPHRPGRVEPRLVKRDPVRYCFLTIPRDKARQKCLS